MSNNIDIKFGAEESMRMVTKMDDGKYELLLLLLYCKFDKNKEREENTSSFAEKWLRKDVLEMIILQKN